MCLHGLDPPPFLVGAQHSWSSEQLLGAHRVYPGGSCLRKQKGCSQFTLAWGKWWQGVFAEHKAVGETPSVPLAEGVKSRGSSGLSHGSQTRPGRSPPPRGRGSTDVPILPLLFAFCFISLKGQVTLLPPKNSPPASPGVPDAAFSQSSLSCHQKQQIWHFLVITPKTLPWLRPRSG